MIHHAAGSLVNVSRPVTRKGETSRLLYQTIGPFKVLGHASPPNSGGGYNVYRLEHLSTGKVTTFNVRDIVPFISSGAYERVLEEQQEEKEEDSDEALADEDFDPQPGDFLLFPNFQDVPYHLIRVKTRPFTDHITFNYYGVKKTNKTRLKGWQLVWTHPSKSELQSNSEVKLKGYEVADVELPLTAVCQKVIVPVEYTYCGKNYFRLKKADVKDVLKYKSLD